MKSKTGKAKPSVGKNVKDSKAEFLNTVLVARMLAKDVACESDEKGCYFCGLVLWWLMMLRGSKCSVFTKKIS